MTSNQHSVWLAGDAAPLASGVSAPVVEETRPDISVIVVNWNTHDYLALCLASIVSDRGVVLTGDSSAAVQPGEIRAEVIVVDNASDDGSAAMVAAMASLSMIFSSSVRRLV